MEQSQALVPPQEQTPPVTDNTPPIEIGADERLAIIGATGSGKTVIAKYLLMHTKRAIVIDPKHTFQLKGFKKITGTPMFPGSSYHYLYQPRQSQDEKMAQLLIYFWHRGDTIIYIDELSTIADGYDKSISVLSEIARTGRERKVGLWVVMQRPRFVPKLFLTEAEHFLVFSLRNQEDRSYVSGYAGEEVRDSIEKYEFWYTSPKLDGTRLLRLNVETERIQELQYEQIP